MGEARSMRRERRVKSGERKDCQTFDLEPSDPKTLIIAADSLTLYVSA
jgi:hypothetical protein